MNEQMLRDIKSELISGPPLAPAYHEFGRPDENHNESRDLARDYTNMATSCYNLIKHGKRRILILERLDSGVVTTRGDADFYRQLVEDKLLNKCKNMQFTDGNTYVFHVPSQATASGAGARVNSILTDLNVPFNCIYKEKSSKKMMEGRATPPYWALGVSFRLPTGDTKKTVAKGIKQYFSWQEKAIRSGDIHKHEWAILHSDPCIRMRTCSWRSVEAGGGYLRISADGEHWPGKYMEKNPLVTLPPGVANPKEPPSNWPPWGTADTATAVTEKVLDEEIEDVDVEQMDEKKSLVLPDSTTHILSDSALKALKVLVVRKTPSESAPTTCSHNYKHPSAGPIRRASSQVNRPSTSSPAFAAASTFSRATWRVAPGYYELTEHPSGDGRYGYKTVDASQIKPGRVYYVKVVSNVGKEMFRKVQRVAVPSRQTVVEGLPPLANKT